MFSRPVCTYFHKAKLSSKAKSTCLPERRTTAVFGITNWFSNERFTLMRTFIPSKSLSPPFTCALTRTMPFSSTNGLISLTLPVRTPAAEAYGVTSTLSPTFINGSSLSNTVKSTSILPVRMMRQNGSLVFGMLYCLSKRLATTPSKGATKTACFTSYSATSY